MKDNHLSKMKLLLSFLLLTTLTCQALAQSSCPSNAAPNDQVARCATQYRHTYPNDWRVLMDSINYLELIDDRDGRWQRQDEDGTGTTWQQAGGICGHEVSVCEVGTNRNNWFFTQYICYLDAREVFVNVTYDFTGCCCGCQSRVTFHRYERDDPNAAAARNPNNYNQLQVVTGRSGFGLILGNKVCCFLPSNNSHGFYIGVQDTGSCVSIRRLTLYYRISPGRTEGVTVIPEIPLPPQCSTGNVNPCNSSCPCNAAPNDQDARCVTDDPQYRHTYPDNWRVLMDSINYLELIDNRDGVWQRQDVDGTGTTWQQAGGMCGHEVSVCELGTNRNNWFFTQYICYLDAREVIVNVTYNFTGCVSDCKARMTFHRYERNDPNAAAARDPNNYDQLRVVTGTSGLNLGNTVFHFQNSSNSRGFYIGVQDTGSCVSIRRLTIYYRISPGRTEVLPHPSTGVATCLPNAVPAPGTSLEIECDANGVCTDDPRCVCSRGYEFVAATTHSAAFCRVCPPGTYQARDSNDFSCQPCPANSEARDPATDVCECEFNFNRLPGQPGEPCTRPPSSPRVAINNPPTVSDTSITVCWLPSLETGGRSDLHYNIYLLQNGGGSNTYQLVLTENSNINANPNTPLCRTLRNLTPGASYSVVITAANGATDDPDSFTDVSVVQDRFIVFYFAAGSAIPCACPTEPSGTPDVNECNTNNGGCAQICTNTQGSFRCSCRSGYRLNGDGRSCRDINECTEGTHNCNQICTNTQGSFRCSCRSGYRLNGDGRTCDETPISRPGLVRNLQVINGVVVWNEPSSTGGEVTGYDLRFYASGGQSSAPIRSVSSAREWYNPAASIIPSGRLVYVQVRAKNSAGTGTWINQVAYDVNECNTNNGGCSQRCTNTQGSFQCSCNSGYRLNGNGRTCDDVNECNTNNGGCAQLCTNTQGSFQCSCRNGYRLSCTDINECTEGTHDCDQICTNTQGSFLCSCRSGFTLASDGRTCTTPITCATGCGGTLRGNSGCFNSPGWPESYPVNIDCEWNIELASTDRVIQFTYNESVYGLAGNTPCPRDYVEIFDGLADGNVPSLGRSCFRETPPPVVTSTSQSTVRFHAGPSHNPSRRGFRLTYEAVDNS